MAATNSWRRSLRQRRPTGRDPLGGNRPLGSVYQLLDSTEAVAEHCEFDAFGAIYAVDDQSGNAVAPTAMKSSVGYTGKHADPDTGLVYYSARWYDPTTGRFLAEDPIQEGSNWYAYAGNNPINYRDPTGLSPQGNPLNNLFGGGYSGGKLAPAPKPITLNTSLLASPTYGVGPVRPTNTSTSTVRSGVTSLPVYLPSGPLQTTGTKGGPRLVREITPNSAIVPRDVQDLPGVRAAIDNPNRYVVSNHSNQGNFVVDLKDGSVRFVTGDNYLPTQELNRRSQIQGRAAADQAKFYTAVQEGLVSVSIAHETARDYGVLFGGYDYVEPGRTITYQDRQFAAFGLIVPGGNSTELRYADEALEGLRIRGRNIGQEQGREFRVEQLQLYEFDANQPKHVRGYLQNERRRIAGSGGGPDIPRTPQGYEQAHGRNTPAREGFDYSNSTLQGIDLNKLEERVRRRTGRE